MRGQSLVQWSALGIVVLLLLAGCSSTAVTAATPGPSPTATASAAAATSTPATSPTASGYPVRVFFSKHPDSDNDVNAVFPVDRVSPTLGVATYATQQLIAGPTSAEASGNLYTPFTGAISGSSNCGGPDFQITLDMRGPTPETGTATVRFCRTVALAGDLTGARIRAEVNATLTQFSNIHKVVILTSAGGCFDDFSGMNACLH